MGSASDQRKVTRVGACERSRGDASDIDGQNREVEMCGSPRVNADSERVSKHRVTEAKPESNFPSISLADAFAAAFAKTRSTESVTGDRDFKVLEGDLEKVRWLK